MSVIDEAGVIKSLLSSGSETAEVPSKWLSTQPRSDGGECDDIGSANETTLEDREVETETGAAVEGASVLGLPAGSMEPFP